MGDIASMLHHLLSLALVVAAAVAAPTSTQVQPTFVYGHAAYTYGPLHCTGNPCDVVPSCNKAHWAKDIEAFNTDHSISNASISTIYSYGGDVEFWPNKNSPKACQAPAVEGTCNYTSYYDENNEKAADVYRKSEGIKQVVALLDARLDGWDMITAYNKNDACNFGDFYPNLNNLSAVQLGHLAKQTASLFCRDANLGGIQVDLEPYQDPYKQSLETFLGSMVKEMEDEDGSNGCRDAVHPEGRTTSYFTFAHRTRDDFGTTIMSKNGYFVFSGYDILPKNDAFEYNTVEEFGNNLIAEVPEIHRCFPSSHFVVFRYTIATARLLLVWLVRCPTYGVQYGDSIRFNSIPFDYFDSLTVFVRYSLILRPYLPLPLLLQNGRSVVRVVYSQRRLTFDEARVVFRP